MGNAQTEVLSQSPGTETGGLVAILNRNTGVSRTQGLRRSPQNKPVLQTLHKPSSAFISRGLRPAALC